MALFGTDTNYRFHLGIIFSSRTCNHGNRLDVVGSDIYNLIIVIHTLVVDINNRCAFTKHGYLLPINRDTGQQIQDIKSVCHLRKQGMLYGNLHSSRRHFILRSFTLHYNSLDNHRFGLQFDDSHFRIAVYTADCLITNVCDTG